MRSTVARGYGAQHRRLRREVAPAVASGQARCCRCGERIEPWQDWHLDHADDRRSYLGVAHAECNRRAGAILGSNRRRHRRRMTRMEAAEQAAQAWATRERAYWAERERERLAAAPRPRPRIY